jgi:hypothetical protein
MPEEMPEEISTQRRKDAKAQKDKEIWVFLRLCAFAPLR